MTTSRGRVRPGPGAVRSATPRAALTGLVVAAQAGHPEALDRLVRAYLPVVYAVAGRAVRGRPDVDDVVQDTMLRALRDLRALRRPESFPTWLMAIAVRQVGTHQRRRHLAAQRTATLDDIADSPDIEADLDGVAEVAGQHRRLVRAGRWLDPDDRALLSLWRRELTGELTRLDLAAAIGATPAHAGVRIQRMRAQLAANRSLVAALDATPRCGALATAVADWDGRPVPLWRKRIARHIRTCAYCAGLVPTSG